MAISEQDRAHVALQFTTRATIEDVTGDLVISAASMADLRKVLKAFPQAGITPVAPAQAWATTPEGLPICPRHGVPMRKREKQGDFWHSHNAGSDQDEAYCRGYAGKDSPGWNR